MLIAKVSDEIAAVVIAEDPLAWDIDGNTDVCADMDSRALDELTAKVLLDSL